MRKAVFTTALVVLCVVSISSLSLGVSRFTATLDGGATVTVDNNSSMTNNWVAGRVLAADRSMQDDCPYAYPPYKGLFKTGDRIFVNDNYIAWFDYTVGDGITYSAPCFYNGWCRSGELAGFWTLNPNTDNFRYQKTGPNGCNNWAHNELIPGSASPNQEQHWWDAYAPPTEHSMGIVSGGNVYFTSYTYCQNATNGNFTVVADGTTDGNGYVHYETSGRMTTPSLNVDITDDNDSNGISNYIQCNVRYICRTNDIFCTWTWKPNNANVVCKNIFQYIWVAYAQDEDGTDCDTCATGSQWPGTVYGQPLYCSSSMTLYRSRPSGGPYSSGTIVEMILGDTCPDPDYNVNINTSPPLSVGGGDWIRIGESSTLSINSPRFQYTNLGVPGTGSGTLASPYIFQWHKLIFGNETGDGCLDFGSARGPYSDPADYVTFQSAKYYRASWALRSNF